MVKPTRPAIETNLVVNTDRRTLPDRAALPLKKALHAVSLPGSTRKTGPAVSRALPPNSDHSGSGSAAATVTSSMATARRGVRSMPTMMAARFYNRVLARHCPRRNAAAVSSSAQDGKPELVNYRAYKNVLIVDRLFAAAELRPWRRERQQKVRVVRHDGGRVVTGSQPTKSPDPVSGSAPSSDDLGPNLCVCVAETPKNHKAVPQKYLRGWQRHWLCCSSLAR